MEFPQEVELWYVIPLIRKELAKALKSLGLKQRQIAVMLNLTESAVSQYIQNKRACDIDLTAQLKTEIIASANKIAAQFSTSNKTTKLGDNQIAFKEINRLCELVRANKFICKIHRSKNTKLDKCSLCYD